MTTLMSRFSSRLGMLVAVTGLIISATAQQAVAQAALGSDQMRISVAFPGGPVLFDTTVPEGTPELGLIFDPTGGLVPPPGYIPAGTLTANGFIGPIADPVNLFTFVILAEPLPFVPDPGEPAPPIYIGAGNIDYYVSDVLINGLNSLPFQAGQFPPILGLLSDGNIDLNNLINALAPGVWPVVFEDGTMQDLTLLMGYNLLPDGAGGLFPVSVQVRSDIEKVPEPSTMILAGLGGLALLAWRRHHR